jgi:hypothetical protein
MIAKRGFTPISIANFVSDYLKINPGEDREILTSRLKNALEAHKRGETCSCGAPLWVIGSAVAERACFTCITMESIPDSDYEIDEACREGKDPESGNGPTLIV